jgi:hypothetical protein
MNKNQTSTICFYNINKQLDKLVWIWRNQREWERGERRGRGQSKLDD